MQSFISLHTALLLLGELVISRAKVFRVLGTVGSLGRVCCVKNRQRRLYPVFTASQEPEVFVFRS